MPTTTETAAGPAVPAQGGSADEDCSTEFAPVVQLAQVETKTGEEEEKAIFKMRAKLFRFSMELKEWKERGTGDVRLMQHESTRKIRLLMRREKTLKICLNHFVNPAISLRENVGSDRSWVWNAVDYADGEASDDLLAIRFKDSKNALLFKEAYEKAAEEMAGLLSKSGDGDEKAEEKNDEKEGDETKDEGEPGKEDSAPAAEPEVSKPEAN